MAAAHPKAPALPERPAADRGLNGPAGCTDAAPNRASAHHQTATTCQAAAAGALVQSFPSRLKNFPVAADGEGDGFWPMVAAQAACNGATRAPALI